MCACFFFSSLKLISLQYKLYFYPDTENLIKLVLCMGSFFGGYLEFFRIKNFFSLTKQLHSNRESSDFRMCSKPQTSLQLYFLISKGSKKHFGKETTEIILKQVLDAHVKALFFYLFQFYCQHYHFYCNSERLGK